MRDAKTISEEAVQLRAQAKAMHKAAQDRVEQNHAEVGVRIDQANRAAASARAEAKAAGEQAAEAHKEAARLAAEADEHADPSEAKILRASAIGRSERAEQAHRAAQEAAERADELTAEAARITTESNSEPLMERRAIEYAADKLDQKADRLEQAADTYRRIQVENQQDSQAMGEPLGAERLQEEVGKLLAEADSIKPDFTGVPTEVLRDAGVPLSQQPGSELIDPMDGSPAPAQAPPAVDVHGDDLISPYAASYDSDGTTSTDADGGYEVQNEFATLEAAPAADSSLSDTGMSDPFPAEESYTEDYAASGFGSYESDGDSVDDTSVTAEEPITYDNYA